MKNVVVLCLILLLVAGVAVNGSRAQAVSATSIAFQQCVGQSAAGAERCEPLVRPLVAQTEFEAAGAREDAAGAGMEAAGAGNAEIGESRGAAYPLAVAYLVWEVATYLLDRLVFQRGGSTRLPSPTIVTEAVFDPAR